MTMDDIRKQLMEAAAKGDVEAVLKLTAEADKLKKAEAKEKAEAAAEEAKKLAGVRTELAEKIGAAFKPVSVKLFFDKATQTDSTNAVLEGVKATGYYFEYSIEKGISFGLRHPTVKVAHSGGGSTGKSKAEFGMSLDEIFQKFATDEDKAKLEAAASNSAKWTVKVTVKKAAIAAGLLQPVK